MLQRKQTIYLFIAVICFIASSCLPLGYLIPESMGVESIVNSIGVVDGNTGTLSYPYYALPMFFLALNAFHSLAIIFMYKNLKNQALNCMIQIVAIIVEYIAGGMLIYTSCVADKNVSFDSAFGLFLPIVAMISIIFAHKGIKADINLLKSVDRIR